MSKVTEAVLSIMVGIAVTAYGSNKMNDKVNRIAQALERVAASSEKSVALDLYRPSRSQECKK